VIEADDVEPALAGRAQRREVIGRVDQKSRRRLVSEVPRPHRRDHLSAAAQQQAATLIGRRLPGVKDDRVSYFRLRTSYFLQMASTAMAIPIPPPMQSDATP
jgi:hypothetical protein